MSSERNRDRMLLLARALKIATPAQLLGVRALLQSLVNGHKTISQDLHSKDAACKKFVGGWACVFEGVLSNFDEMSSKETSSFEDHVLEYALRGYDDELSRLLTRGCCHTSSTEQKK
ncbi:MAG: hypothetical protein HY226_06855 [Candidatus Vogelbacteria bacterium]|nr:hypothetical protein [Candidatus Vogelbacteria bacterium]